MQVLQLLQQVVPASISESCSELQIKCRTHTIRLSSA
jgi:hypothetical protein